MKFMESGRTCLGSKIQIRTLASREFEGRRGLFRTIGIRVCRNLGSRIRLRNPILFGYPLHSICGDSDRYYSVIEEHPARPRRLSRGDPLTIELSGGRSRAAIQFIYYILDSFSTNDPFMLYAMYNRESAVEFFSTIRREYLLI